MPMSMRVSVLLLLVSMPRVSCGESELRQRASVALERAVEFFAHEVATEGGYLWRYSDDLRWREGEGKAEAGTVWVQPPGTPSVGLAFLEAYQATGRPDCLAAALAAGECLVRGQLQSGGWDYRIEFVPKQRKRYAYRVDAPVAAGARNTTTLDDDTTQAALRFLMRLDQATQFKDAKLHEAVAYGLSALIAAQYPNGAWPQRFQAAADPAQYPVKKAGYPAGWSRTFPAEKYAGYYTFNDHAMDDMIQLMIEAWRIYGEDRYRRAATRCGDFILLAQMPEPQPAWAQQYDVEMHPAWARKFEPPAVSGGESQGILETLMLLSRETGDRKYLEPIPRAIAYLRRSILPSGQLARFYELETNRPLYFTRAYQLTYGDEDLPTHYAFKVGQNVDKIEREYRRLAATEPADLSGPQRNQPRPAKVSEAQVERVLAAIDARGRWVESGRLKYHGDDVPVDRIIDCRTFIQNLRVLSAYLAGTPGKRAAAETSGPQ